VSLDTCICAFIYSSTIPSYSNSRYIFNIIQDRACSCLMRRKIMLTAFSFVSISSVWCRVNVTETWTCTYSVFFSVIMCIGLTVRSHLPYSGHGLRLVCIPFHFRASISAVFHVLQCFNNSLQTVDTSLNFLQRSFQLVSHGYRIGGLCAHTILLDNQLY